jgi:hypothetical protein
MFWGLLACVAGVIIGGARHDRDARTAAISRELTDAALGQGRRTP